MNSKPIFTYLSILGSIVSAVLFYFDFSVAASIICIISFFVVFPDFEKFTNDLQIGMFFTSALIMGTGLEYSNMHLPLLTLSMLLNIMIMTIRFIFMSNLGYSGKPWLEPVLLISSLSVYLIGNIVNPIGWQGWLFPGILLLIGTYFTYHTRSSGKYLLKNCKSGYAAEVGKHAPVFSLYDNEGTLISNSDFKDINNLLLIFVKGDWCPTCHMMLRTYEKNREKFQKKNIYVMAIGPDPVGVNKEMVCKLGLKYKLLSDERQETVEKYGIKVKHYPGAPKQQETTPLPAAFLIDKKGILRFSSRPSNPGEFLNPSLIFSVLESLS